MIVRDEERVIVRCLDSVRPFITHWAIVDTGSTDQTVGLIQQALKSLPGEFRSEPWTGNFSFHRNQCLALANTISDDTDSLLLFIDADETLVVHDLPKFQRMIRSRSILFWWATDGDWRFRKLGIVAANQVVSWRGAVHESLLLKTDFRVGNVVQRVAEVIYGNDGIRRRTQGTHATDVNLLAGELAERTNYRGLLFLALTHEAAGEMELAAVNFRTASELINLPFDERWQSLWGLGRVLLHVDVSEACKVLTEANRLAPKRAEPIVALAEIARMQGQFIVARVLAEAALTCPEPNATSMYDKSAFGWRAVDELCLSAFATCDYYAMRRAAAAYDDLLSRGTVPDSELSRILSNLELTRRTVSRQSESN